MRGFRRRFATLLAATMLVSGLSFAQVSAEETVATEPVETSELVEMEESSETGVIVETAEPENSSKIVIGVTSDGGFISREKNADGKIVISENTISDNVMADPQWNVRYVNDMDDLVTELGASNVSRISDTEIKLINDVQFSDYDVLSLVFTMPELILDFNGNTCNGLISFTVESGSVTLLDSSGNHSGGIRGGKVDAGESGTYAPSCLDVVGGSLTIKAGTYSGCSQSVFATEGNLAIHGGIFEESSDNEGFGFLAVVCSAGLTSARITGGEFSGDLYAMLCYREPIFEPEKSMPNPLKISGGSFSCTESGYGAITYQDNQTSGYPDINEILAISCTFVPSNIYEDGFMDTYNSFTAMNVSVEMGAGVEGFVYRMYSMALGREPDPNGYTSWVNQLKAKTISGSDAAFGFFFSSELANRNLSNKEFITLLYNVFLNRTPDDVGMQAWLSALESGASRKYVFAGFANSQEWKGLCADCGIAPGSFCSDEPRDQNIKVTAFAQRLYTLCLNRNADVPGLNYWTDALVKKTQDGAHVAHGFFFSAEFTGRNLSNADYVEVLYQVLLGRGSDSTGRANWVAQLESGKSRLEIFKGFVHSAEFDAICKDYGITRGSI